MVTNKQKRSSNGQRATGRGPAGAHTRRDARENGAVKGRLKGAEAKGAAPRAVADSPCNYALWGTLSFSKIQ